MQVLPHMIWPLLVIPCPRVMHAAVYEKGRAATKLRNLQTVTKTCQNAGLDFPGENGCLQHQLNWILPTCYSSFLYRKGSDNMFFFRGPQPPPLLGVVDPPTPPLPTIEEGYASCRVALRTWQWPTAVWLLLLLLLLFSAAQKYFLPNCKEIVVLDFYFNNK